MHKVERGVQQTKAGLVRVGRGDLGQDGVVPLRNGVVDNGVEARASWDLAIHIATGLFDRDPGNSNTGDDFLVTE